MDIFPYVETLKVGAAYAALLYIWPNAVFRGVLRGKGLTFRFLFCAIVQPLLISTVVLGLGLLHILNIWLVRLLFWGALAASLLLLLRSRRGAPAPRAAEALAAWWTETRFRYRKNLIEYTVLAVILLFATAFYLNGAFHDYSFGFYDQYIHNEWTRALVKGEIFSAGIYPEGMHCFLYALHVLFGVRLYSCVVFLGGLHNASMFLLAAYCLFKELLRSRHAVLLVLAAWAVFDGIGPAALDSMARLSWTLPQEFALYLVFLCPLALLRFLRGRDGSVKWYRDWNLLFLAAGVALAFSTHFYALSMAFFPCCAVILAHFVELRPVRRLLPPVCAALCGLGFGALPMLAAYAMGTKLQGSLWWGVSTMRGESANSAVMSVPSAGQGPLETLSRMADALYRKGWSALFGKPVAVLLILASLLMLALAVAGTCVRLRKKPQQESEPQKRRKPRKGRKPKKGRNPKNERKPRQAVFPAGLMEGYLVLAASLAASVFLYAMPYMGLPELVHSVRALCPTQMLAFGMVGIVADLLILLAEGVLGRALPGALMALGCLFLYIIAYQVDFHQTAFWWLCRYNAAVTVTDRIVNKYPEGTYKVVSLWDDACQVGEEEFEELPVFLKGVEEGGYSIPTEYIFLYVEKNPIRWKQIHFTTAPRWLALDNYETKWPAWNPNWCPVIWSSKISPEEARKKIDYDSLKKEYYANTQTRVTLFSKAYVWYGDFSAAHPEDTEVYYEDDNFVCYVIRQDPAAPLDLSANAAG